MRRRVTLYTITLACSVLDFTCVICHSFVFPSWDGERGVLDYLYYTAWLEHRLYITNLWLESSLLSHLFFIAPHNYLPNETCYTSVAWLHVVKEKNIHIINELRLFI